MSSSSHLPENTVPEGLDQNANGAASATDLDSVLPQDGSAASGVESTSQALTSTATTFHAADAVISMSDIISANLPFDIQLQIMKEYMRSWSTRIPFPRGTGVNSMYPLYPAFDDKYPFTNRATLVYGDNLKKPDKQLSGWMVLPLPRLTNYSYEYEWFSPENGSSWFRYKHHWAMTDDFRLGKILEIVSSSESFSGPIETFFFGNMIWQFNLKDDLNKICSHRGRYGCHHKPLPLTTIGKIKNISLSSDRRNFSWTTFSRLFNKMYDIVSQSANGFKGLRSLELSIDHPSGIYLDPCRLLLTYLNRRIRYLVTHCYMMVQKRSDLVICLRTSFNRHRPYGLKPFETQLPPEEQGNAENEGEEKPKKDRSAAGFSKNDARDFLNGTWVLFDGLKSIEFSHIINPETTKMINPRVDWPIFWWMMAFAREWAAIWDKGIEVSEECGGYAAVYCSGMSGAKRRNKHFSVFS